MHRPSGDFRPLQINIVHLMILAVAVAIGLATHRFAGDPRYTFAAFLMVPLGVLLFAILFLPSPLKSVLANPPAETDAHIAALEKALGTNRNHSNDAYVQACSRLMELYASKKRYEDAIEQGRTVVRIADLTHESEAETRLRIAVWLDLLGRKDEAAAEREAADATLDGQPTDFLGWSIQGELFDWKRQYTEALDAYEQALAFLGPDEKPTQGNFMLRGAVAALNAGRPDDVLKWAKQVFALGASMSNAQLALSRRLAGIACASLGRLDEAQRHYERAHALALENGDPQEIAETLACQAQVAFQRGHLETAEANCLEIESAYPGKSRVALMTHASIHRARGHFHQALERLKHAAEAGVLPSASRESHGQAVLQSATAHARSEAGDYDGAWVDLAMAIRMLGDGSRLKLILQATRFRLRVLCGEREAAIKDSEILLDELQCVPQDRSVQLDCLDRVGRGLVEARSYDRAARCWERFLALAPPPIGLPVGHYYLGECCWQLGQRDEAVEEFRRAEATGIECLHTQLARQRLDELKRDD